MLEDHIYSILDYSSERFTVRYTGCPMLKLPLDYLFRKTSRKKKFQAEVVGARGGHLRVTLTSVFELISGVIQIIFIFF